MGQIQFTNGLGGVSGSQLATLNPITSTGDVWYVNSATGTDAAAPAGKERQIPLATIQQAITNASTGDTIDVMAGHTQIMVATLSIVKILRIIGEGSGTNRPQFTRNGFVGPIFTLGKSGILLDNFLFQPTFGGASTDGVVAMTSGTSMNNCAFILANGDPSGVDLNAPIVDTNVYISNTSFISSSASVVSRPGAAIRMVGGVTRLDMNGVSFDGDGKGWTSGYAFNSNGFTVSDMTALNIDLLNDADLIMGTSSRFFIHVRNRSGSARIVGG